MERADDDGVSGKGEEGGVTEGGVAGQDVGKMSTSSIVVDVGVSSSSDGLLPGMGDSQDL